MPATLSHFNPIDWLSEKNELPYTLAKNQEGGQCKSAIKLSYLNNSDANKYLYSSSSVSRNTSTNVEINL